MKVKQHWIGKKWYLPGPNGNDIQKTNVPNIRVAFRHETLKEELQMIDPYANADESSDQTKESSTTRPPCNSPPGFSSSVMIGASSLVEPTKLQQDMIHSQQVEPRGEISNTNQETLGPEINNEASNLWQSIGTSPSHDYTFPGASVLAQRARQRRLSQDGSSNNQD
jgi:hypothetical protein